MTLYQSFQAMNAARKKLQSAIHAAEWSRSEDDAMAASAEMTEALNDFSDAQSEWHQALLAS